MTETKRPTILLVDDEKSILDALYRFCRQRKWKAIRANGGEEGLAALQENEVDVIISDMRMPKMDGAEFLTKAKDASPLSVRILLTGYADMEAVINAVNGAKIYNYLNKPWDDNMLESIVTSALDFQKKEVERINLARELDEKNQELGMFNAALEEKVKERTQELQQSSQKVSKNFREFLSLISKIIEMRDGSKANYNHIVSTTSAAIATTMELSPKEVEQIRIAGMLHNIGKLSLPETIQKKSTDTLSTLELATYHKHPIQGEAVLCGMTGVKVVSKLIRSHCEYIDGSGYPDKTRGDAIPLGSRIICVASDFHKLESGLLIKGLTGVEAAIQHIQDMSGKHYDARIVDLFIKYFDEHLQNYQSAITHVTLEELEPGMILAEDLLSETGMLLLTQETTLTNENLNQLSKYQADIGTELIFPVLNTESSKPVEKAS